MSNRSQQATIPLGFEYIEPLVRKFLADYPHVDRNVFVMMPFTSPYTESIYKAVSDEVSAHGLIPLRANQRSFSQILWWNIVTYMLGSSYGIVIYEPKEGIPFNPNVSIEAGFMLALDRPVLFLANSELKGLPVDFSGHIFKTYALTSLNQTVKEAVKDWIAHDLSYYNYGRNRVIVFVSLGGTCRCVMAKGVLSQLLYEKKITGITVEAAAAGDPHHSTVSPSAIKVLEETGCDQWLIGHRPRKLSQFLQDRADLIIVLTDKGYLRTDDQHTKVITDENLFGEQIINPYPDGEDEESLHRYRNSKMQLELAIQDNLDKILQLIDAVRTI